MAPGVVRVIHVHSPPMSTRGFFRPWSNLRDWSRWNILEIEKISSLKKNIYVRSSPQSRVVAPSSNYESTRDWVEKISRWHGVASNKKKKRLVIWNHNLETNDDAHTPRKLIQYIFHSFIRSFVPFYVR